MKKPKFLVQLEYDEEGSHRFFVNDSLVGYCDRDSVGRDGVEGMQNLFDNIADELGVEVKKEYIDEH